MSSDPEEIKARVVVHGADADADADAEWARPELEAFHLPSTSQPPHLFHPPHPEPEAAEQSTPAPAVAAATTNNASGSPPPPRSPPPAPLETEQLPPNAKPPADEKPPPPAPAAALRDLFRFADGLDRVLMAVGTLGALVHGCSLPVFLRFFADLVDSFGSHADDPDTMVRLVVRYAFYFLVVGAAIWASSWAEISCWMWTGERQSTRMRIRYLQAALKQDVSFFDTDVRTSDVIYAINADAVIVQDAISEKLGNLIHYMATFVAGFVVGFTAAWQLALVTLAVVPLIAVIGGLTAATMGKLSSKSQDALSSASNIAEQALSQIRIVQSFVGEQRVAQAYSAALAVAQSIGYRNGFAKGLGLGGTYFTVFCCYALLLWYGGHLVRGHHTNGGLAIATMFSVMIGGLALGQSAPSMAAFAKARVAAAKIFRIIDHTPGITKEGVELESVTGRLELRNVEFAYPSRPDTPILRRFSLSVPAGKTIALVGSSGSGKSTVVSLIERFYDPSSGQIMLDGVELKDLKLRWLRSQIGLVSQEPALFATSIRENLLLGREEASQVEMEEAARVANAHSFIRMQEQAHEAALVSARRSSARPSSARNSVSSPIMMRNSSYGRSPYSRRLSDFSTADFSLSVIHDPAAHRMGMGMEKLAFRAQASSFWRLAKMNSPEWGYALAGSVGSMVCGSFSAIFAYILSAVLSIYYTPDPRHMDREITKYCYLLIGMSSAALLFNTVQHLFWDTVGENLTKRVREKMLTAVLRNEMAWFDMEANASAHIAARLALDAQNVRSAIGDRISIIVQNSALMLVACTAGFVLQWRLALVLLAVFPLVVGATVLQKMFMKGFSGDLEGAHAKATQIAGEAVANVRTVAAFNSEDKITRLFEANLQRPLRRCFWKGQIAGIGYGVAQFLLYASYALGLWYAAWLVKHGISDFSKTIRVFMVLMVSANGAAETLTLAPDFIKGGRAMQSVFETIDRKTEIEPDDVDAAAVPERPRGDVELKHVDFSYPSRPDIQVFRDLSLRARAGRTLALVGPSGCGKSSVLALIQRFYEPSSGRVLLDGKDIRKYNLKALRRVVAMVPQEPFLFAGTIHDNIAYGREGATEAEVVEAATQANAHKFVSALPEGYKTCVGERGVQLSGGQRQRIAIARALVKQAAIMLLDEATSALDAESERCVQEALDRAGSGSGRTTIVVAHRLATVRNAHTIAVIDDGKVVEQGSHSHLLNHHPDGCYARMLQFQRLTPHTLAVPGPSASNV
ncbi:unnamed protein product [Triticum turgidum subsp. durum]|uniref:Uncharacterized protein n=1 Tax=Triticum turgidum subsp. durum TaxID=4567 RepID=A0A9R1C048_TRITD|nr:unnamed protein product [Triticum turgidum subsp. durum]